MQTGTREPGFLDKLRAVTAANPEAIALIEPGGRKMTFADLEAHAAAAAQAVVDLGLTGGDVAALALPDGIELITSFIGIASTAGCAILNPSLPGPEFDAALVALNVRALVASLDLSPAAVESARVLGIPVLAPEPAATGPHPPRLTIPGGSQTALLLQTSGTSAKARIVPLSHANLLAMASTTIRSLDLGSGDRLLSMMPLFHLTGLMSSLAQLLAGGSVICTSGFEAGAFAHWVTEHHPTWYNAGPAMHNAIVPLIESRPCIMEGTPLRFARSIGAPLPAALMERLESALHAPMLEGYGMTEAGLVASNTPHCRKPGSVGRISGSDVAITNERGEPLPQGAEGEIVVRGPAVIQSYLDNPEANSAAFRDGWFRTGDVGRFDADGFLFVTGRIKDIINRGGEKVMPGEVENVLSAHPGVHEAVVFGVAHPTLGEDVMAAVVPRPGHENDQEDLRLFVQARVAVFKVPRRIFFLAEIPKGATGKPARQALAAQLKSQIDAAPAVAGGMTAAEIRIVEIWKRILRIDDAGPNDDFFQLGGDSLALTLMLLEVELEFGAHIQPEVVSTPTIAALARIVAGAEVTLVDRSPLVALQPHGSHIPFFCIPGADENPYYFMDLARSLGQDRPFIVVRDPRPLQQRGIYTVEQHAELICNAIRSERPEGPYLLGGHCYGGILAFEAARQLSAAGQRIALLALFEVPTPGYPKVVRHWRKYLKQSVLLASRVAKGDSRQVWPEVKRHASVVGQLLGKRTQGATRQTLQSFGMTAPVEDTGRIDRRNFHAGRAYVPGRLDCSLTHFIAADEFHSTLVLDDPRLGWAEMTGRGFSVCPVPGIADRIFRPPHVYTLAEQLNRRLDLAELAEEMPVRLP